MSLHRGADVEIMSPTPADGSSTVRPPLRCPMCTGFSTKGPVRGFMLHLTSRHCGAAIDENARATLHGLERGICTECYCLRPFASRTCHRCSCSSPPRDIRVGDCIHGTRRQERNLEETGVETGPSQTTLRDLPTGDDRETFFAEVRALAPLTEIHIPMALRDRHAAITADLLERISKQNVDSCFLEEIRTKLLLSPVPKSRNRRVELSLRLRLWSERNLWQLLYRIQDQARSASAYPKSAPSVQRRGKKARHLVLEGARSRAVTTLTSDVAALSPEDEIKYAEELLPCSTRPRMALSEVIPAAELPEDYEVPHSLKGVRFKALSAPRPTGARPEHLRELFGMSQ